MAALILSTSAVVPTRRPLRRAATVSLRGPNVLQFRFQQARPASRLQRVCVLAAEGGAGPVNDETFKELVLDSDLPVLVDFTAPWCGPCRMIAPIVDDIAVEYEGKLKAYKLNLDDSPKVAKEFGVKSIPVVMFFKKGVKVDSVVGAVPKPTLIAAVNRNLA